MMKALLIIPILFALHALAGCGIAPSLHADEQVKAAFSDVITRYDERLGLADEAIALARHYLPAQASTFKDIADARSAIEALHATPALVDERALFERFDVAQRQMTEAISQLLVVCESVRGLDTAPACGRCRCGLRRRRRASRLRERATTKRRSNTTHHCIAFRSIWLQPFMPIRTNPLSPPRTARLFTGIRARTSVRCAARCVSDGQANGHAALFSGAADGTRCLDSISSAVSVRNTAGTRHSAMRRVLPLREQYTTRNALRASDMHV